MSSVRLYVGRFLLGPVIGYVGHEEPERPRYKNNAMDTHHLFLQEACLPPPYNYIFLSFSGPQKPFDDIYTPPAHVLNC